MAVPDATLPPIPIPARTFLILLLGIQTLAAEVAAAAVPAAAATLPPPKARLPVEFSIRHWSGKDGLPLRTVEAILQTRDGFVWFGMNKGLGRFDGATFQVFDPRNTPALGVSYVTSLAEDPDGSLWIGSAGGGLARYHRGAFQRFSAEHGLANEQVKALHVARDGRLWIGTDGGGAFARDPASGTFQNFGVESGLAEPFVIGITENEEGDLFFVTYKEGPFRLRSNRFERVPLHPPHESGSGFALTRSPQGRVWLGTSSGVYRLETNAFHRWRPAQEIPGHNPVVAWETGENEVWLGTAQGLVHWEDGTWTSYPIGGGSSGRFASAFIRDREGSIWKSVEGAGVVQLRRTKFVTFGVKEGLSDEVITSVLHTRSNALWVGTSRGLHRFTPGRIEHFDREQGLPDRFIFSLAEDSEGSLWTATRLGGLALFHDGRFHPLPEAERLPVRGAWCLTSTRDGSVWVGTSQGAFRYVNHRRAEHLQGQDRLSNDDVRSIAEDRDGALWFGTSYGLNRLVGGRMTSFNALSNLPPMEVVVALHPDADGSLWIGTMTRGLFLHRTNSFHHFGPDTGIHADGIMSIASEGDRALWLGTSRGILRISKRSLDAVANRTAPLLDLQSFGRRDGLAGEECSGTIQPTSAVDSTGRLWIATSEGLATVHPEHIPRNLTPPITRIERVAVEGPDAIDSLAGRAASDASNGTIAPIPPSRELGDVPAPAAQRRAVFGTAGLEALWIPPGLDRIEFQYTGLSFLTPEAVGFLYKLDGYDNDWVNAGYRRVAYYTRIPPGRYVFRVRASNEDSVTSEPALLTVFVAPSWWQRPWLRASVAFAAAGLVVALVGIRLRSLHRKQRASSELSRHLIRSQEQERCRLAGELHDGVGQELQLIRNRSELALDRLAPNPTLSRELQAISATAARAIQGVRSLSRGLRPPELDQLGLTQALRWLATNAAEASDGRLESRVDDVDGCLPRELELDFYRVAQEGLNNAMKHGHATEITLEVERSANQLSLSVFDNGRGFQADQTPEPPDRGSGLKTMNERAAMLGGTLHIRSEPGVGTRLELVVPLVSPPSPRPSSLS